MDFSLLEIAVIIFAFLIVFAILRLMRGETFADKKREEIEMKRQALIAKRKAEAAKASPSSENKTGE